MPKFHFCAHVDLAKLAQAFIQDRRENPLRYRPAGGGWFVQETLLTPSAGMFQWLKQQRLDQGEVLLEDKAKSISEGIREILHRLCPAFTPELYTAPVMQWALFSLLQGDILQGEEWQTLREYLRGRGSSPEDRDQRLYQFSAKIALLFDQYQSYLPRTLAAWARGESLTASLETGKTVPLGRKLLWQPRLWHELCKFLGGVSLAEALTTALNAPEPGVAGAPLPPITIFGATMMPPPYLQLLKQYSQGGEVNFYYHGPCREFWGDNRSTQKVEEGFFQNPLLADNARQAQNFFNLLVEEGLLSGEEEENAGASSSPATLLQAIQEQVRNNVPAPEGAPFRDIDDSLTFHLCHNPRRQVEILRDQLLFLLKTHNNQGGDSPLTLNDILVMAPDITQFAPTIKAVFDDSPLKGRYAVSDRTLRQANLLAETFLKILQLPESRFAISQIDALLDSQPLCQRFGFSPELLPDLRQWLQEGKVHLGYDGASRKKDFERQGITGITEDQDEFTWRKALDRMLLAEIMELPPVPQDQHPSFAGLLPLPVSSTAEGNPREALGNLCWFVEELHSTQEELQDAPQGRTAKEWCTLLQEILERFFLEDTENTEDFSALRKQFRLLEENMKRGKADDLRLSRPLMTSILQGALEAATTSGGSPSFLAGKITCCSLMPMRGIPCRIIALLGMDEGAFPRRDPRQDFSLLNDTQLLPYYVRSKAEEDRYIFLETLLAPREKFLLLYQAFQGDSGEEQPPAMVVKQLLDYAKNLHQKKENLAIRHPLNSFDSRNFTTSAPGDLFSLFSFDARSAEAGQIPDQEDSDTAHDLPSQIPSSLTLSLWDLEKFLENGVKAFQRLSLGCQPIEDQEPESEDQEPLESDNLEKSECRKLLARHLRPLENREDEEVWAKLEKELRARDMLPFGPLGKVAFQDYRTPLTASQDPLENLAHGEAAEHPLDTLGYWEAEEHPLELSLEIPRKEMSPCTVTLRGTCLVTPEKNLLHVCFGEKLANKHRLMTYLERLLWEATGHSSPQKATVFSFAGPQESVAIPAPPTGKNPGDLLQDLVHYYLQSYETPYPVTLELLKTAKRKEQGDGKISGKLKEAISELEPERYFPQLSDDEGIKKLITKLREEIAGFLPEKFPLK